MTNPKILIISGVRERIAELSQKLKCIGDFDVTCTLNDQDSISTADIQRPDLIILDDEKTDNLDGYLVARILQARFYVPFIFISETLNRKRVDVCKTLHFSDYLICPVHDEQLKLSIDLALYSSSITKPTLDPELKYREYLRGVKSIKFRIERKTGIIIDADENLAKLYGYKTREQFIGAGLTYRSDMFSEGDIKIITAHLDQFGELSDFEVKLELAQNSMTWVRLSLKLDSEHGWLDGVIEDVTLEKRATVASMVSEAKYRSVIENANESILVIQDSKIEFANPRFIMFLGFAWEELQQMDFKDFVHPDDRMKVDTIESLSSVTQTAGKTSEIRLISKSGTEFWAEIKSVIIEWRNQLAILLFLRESTQRKMSEEILMESEEKFRLLSEQSMLGIGIIQDGVYIYLNDALPAVFEYTVEEMLSWEEGTFARIVDKRDLPLLNSRFEQKMYAGNNDRTSNIYRAITRSGIQKWIEVYSRPIRYQGKDALLVTIIDITERKKAETELRISEEKYRNVVNNAVEAICILQNDRYKYVNPEALNVFGYSESEMLCLDVWKFVHPEDRDQLLENQKECQESDIRTNEIKHRIITKSGLVRWIGAKAVKIHWEEHPALLVFIEDITEKRQTERLMIQNVKMMSLGGLAAGMAHEINNPLGAILQSASNIQRRLYNELPGNIKAAEKTGIDFSKIRIYADERQLDSMLNMISNTGQKISQIIGNMLQFSRTTDLQKKDEHIPDLILNVLDLLKASYKPKGAMSFGDYLIDIELQPDLPVVSCIRVELEQVIFNLLKNAAFALEEVSLKDHQPLISIRSEVVDSKWFEISIRDNAMGMDEHTKNRLFEPFYSTKPEGSGTGLGLSVSYMIITQHHQGTIEVKSEVGEGSEFIIKLPV